MRKPICALESLHPGVSWSSFSSIMNKTKKAKKSAGLHKIIRYQHREVIELEYVIRDARVLQIVGSGHHRLHMWTNSQIRTADWSEGYKLSQTRNSA